MCPINLDHINKPGQDRILFGHLGEDSDLDPKLVK
jgi:hypothetical protein